MEDAPGIDELAEIARLALPGEERMALVRAWAGAIGAGADWRDHPTWAAIRAHDEAAGLGTRLASRALLRRPSDGRVLLFRYPHRTRAGVTRLIIPGGGAEPGEMIAEAAAREVREETGTAPVSLHGPWMVIVHLLPSWTRIDERPCVQYAPVFVGEIADELPDTEHREPQWLEVGELAALDHDVALPAHGALVASSAAERPPASPPVHFLRSY